MSRWNREQALDTYSIPHWSGGYFDIDEQGHLIARPNRNPENAGIDLYSLTRDLAAAGLTPPILVRFKDILHDRAETLLGAFQRAIEEFNYKGEYSAIYPIKVNQQRSVVEELVSHGGGRVGLEAGSKPELMAVLALADRGSGIVVCNGYKDSEYIRLALIGKRLGLKVYIVVEKLSELEVIIRESRALGIEPLLGIRVRLSSIAGGKWQNSGGEKAKFGLSAMQVLSAIDRLRAAGMIDALRMIHFHMGSQIANIRDIQKGMRECGRFYAELRTMGVPVDTVDVGGGLGVDYEGSRSRNSCSMNYGVQEYANNIVHILAEVCNELELPHPQIISESGRALSAHHAMLIVNVIDEERTEDTGPVELAGEDETTIVKDLHDAYLSLKENDIFSIRSVQELYHDAVHWLAEAQTMYVHGILSLRQRGLAEYYYFAICHVLRERLQPSIRAHRVILDELNERLADKYFCNFSLFQSIPDVWGIEQIFPIVPLHRLKEEPRRRIVIEDITCDSDGRIDHYVFHDSLENSLPVHDLKPDEPYFLGIFMVGAYQEILGDLHNLFGDTDSVNVELKSDGSFTFSGAQRGDTVDKVLRYVNFDPALLGQAYRDKVAKAGLDAEKGQLYLDTLLGGLEGYTYLEE